jgi:hypothetical protein
MRAGISAASVVAFLVAPALLASGAAWAICPPGQTRDCVNLDLLPQISQQIVAGERIPTATKRPPAVEASTPYTGPTIGINKSVRQAPEIGYRWAID